MKESQNKELFADLKLRWWKKWWKQDEIRLKIMDKTHQSWMKQHFTQKKKKKPCRVMLDGGNNNKIVFKCSMIICWAQTKLGGKKMEMRWRMMIMHA
jgi:hypothetical protein